MSAVVLTSCKIVDSDEISRNQNAQIYKEQIVILSSRVMPELAQPLKGKVNADEGGWISGQKPFDQSYSSNSLADLLVAALECSIGNYEITTGPSELHSEFDYIYVSALRVNEPTQMSEFQDFVKCLSKNTYGSFRPGYIERTGTLEKLKGSLRSSAFETGGDTSPFRKKNAKKN